MLNLDQHPYFKEYINEKTGIKSYFLTKKVASLQQHFYFTDTSLTEDGRYLWIRCLNAPAQIQTMGVVSMDEKAPFIKNFPGAGFSGSGNLPCIIKGTHDVVFAERASVWRLSPDGEMKRILKLPDEFLKNRIPDSVLTHASISCDGKYILLDIALAGKWYVATGDMKTGEVRFINNFGRLYDHAMFSPVDPELFMIDQDWWRDWHTGEYFPIDIRTWLMDIHGTRFEPLLQRCWYGHDGNEIAHDFWSKDGMICWVDYNKGAFECDIETREVTHVWKRPLCHSHTTADRMLWCGDQTPYTWNEKPCKVYFYDRKTNKEIEIFSALPCPKVERGGVYHLDSHPSFTDDGEYIISTVTLLDGNADVAITPVKPLLEECRKNGICVGGKDR